jgi:hypothetical protein
MNPRGHKRLALTRVESILVSAMLVVVFGMAVPPIYNFRREAARTDTVNRLAELGKATHAHGTTYNGKMPVDEKFGGSIFYQLLPYVGRQDVYDANATGTVIPAYLSAQDFTRSDGQVGGLGATNYAGNGIIFRAGNIPSFQRSFTPNGTANTVIFGTRYAVCARVNCAWGDTGANTLFSNSLPQFGVAQEHCSTFSVNGFTDAGAIVCMGDGAVRNVSPAVTYSTWQNVTNPNRIELVDVPDRWGE